MRSRALALQSRGIEVLDRLGALGDLPARAKNALDFRVYVDGRFLASFLFGGPVRGGPSGMHGMPQAEIERQLRSRLGEFGVSVEWGSQLGDATQDDSGVTALLTNGSAIRGSWLVGCDGAHSAVRKVAGIDFTGEPVAQRFVLADVRVGWSGDRKLAYAWFEGGNSVLFALELPDTSDSPDLWRFLGTFPLEEAEELDDDGVVDHIRRMLRERARVEEVEIRDVRWTSTFRIQRRLADSYRRQRFFLAGDAAHIHSPIGGQGLNMGIGDAENLAWKLALVVRGLADDALLDTYEAERRPFASRILSGTTKATRLILTEKPLGRLFRDRVVIPLTNLSVVQRRIAEAASQLKDTYRGGPLAPQSDARFARSPRPGDRIADLSCELEDGTLTRLYNELARRWVMVLPSRGGNACVAAAREFLGDELLTVTAVDHGVRDALLIRPDAHLAWRGNPTSTSVSGWLSAALAEPAAPFVG